jgi:hypothetical protein
VNVQIQALFHKGILRCWWQIVYRPFYRPLHRLSYPSAP